MNTKSPITVSGARYIKLGEKGKWEDLCFEEGTLRLGFDEAPHDAALQGDKKSIADVFYKAGYIQKTASNFARQVLDFYDPDPDLLWVTFSKGCLWWCKAKPEVEYFGSEEEGPLGSRLRKTQEGWRNTDINGCALRISDLSGHLTRVAGYRSTICDIGGKALDYLVRKINGQHLPEVHAAMEAHEHMQKSLAQLIKLLTWQDFELFVELVFSQSGWQRISAIGDTQKTVDLELVQPLTKEKAVVQIKAQTDQAQLDSYLDSLAAYGAHRCFYVFHSTDQALNIRNRNNIMLMDVNALAQSALRSGLAEWLIKKVG
ncbi:MAG: restriction endonuclease [Alphaproteobacteria bacterium]|nr:restriction endonuclease [Alphaproteobacteria bacterium]